MEEIRGSMSYYSILGLNPDCTDEEIRKAFRKLAMQWHPDRWTKFPSLLGEATRKFQQIQEAYEVLSDQRKRALYNVGMYDPNDEYDEGFCDFLQEMASLMTQDKNCTMEDLQTMFMEMAEDFDLPSWPCEPLAFEDASRATPSSWPCEALVFKDASIATPSSRTHWDSKRSNLPFHVSGFAMSGY